MNIYPRHKIPIFVVFLSLYYQFRTINQDPNILPRFKTSSICFYIITGHENFIPNGEDMRGHTWEYQLENSPLKYQLIYVSNGPLNISGKRVEILTDSGQTEKDTYLCQRTSNSMIHFIKNFENYDWFFRGTTDTFIVLPNLYKLIAELEINYNPKEEVAMAYAQFEYTWRMYPQGGAGYLFSNYAVKLFVKNIDYYKSVCWADDIAFMNLFELLNISVEKWHTNKFLHNWPQIPLSKNPQNCPKLFYIYPNATGMSPYHISELVSIHMHKIPMPQINKTYFETPGDLGVFCCKGIGEIFCHF